MRPGRYAGGAEVEDQLAVAVDLGVREFDRVGQAQVKFVQQAIGTDNAGVAAAAFTGRVCIDRTYVGGP